MRPLNAFVRVLIGATSGAALFFVLALACSATIGFPAGPADLGAGLAIAAAMMTVGGLIGGIYEYRLWRRLPRPEQDKPQIF